MKHSLLITILALLLCLTGCLSYTQKSDQMRSLVYSGEYSEAIQSLDNSDVAKADRDVVLYHLERGSILYDEGLYPAAAQDWSIATQKMEELYTISLSRQATSFVVNDSYADYEGEAHERILATVFSALAYFANLQPNKAIVEARKTYEIFKVMNANKDPKTTYSRDAFAHYLAGLIYETKGEWDAAIVEYRNALDAAVANESWMEDLSAKTIASSLGRLAEFRGRREVLEPLRRKYPDAKWTPMRIAAEMGEVFVVYEAGRSPIKVPEEILLPVQGDFVRISYPRYRSIEYASHSAKVLVNGEEQTRTVIMQDIGKLAIKALSDRRARDLVKMGARVLVKDQTARFVGRKFGPLAQLATNLLGAATETADTRGWTLLPDTIQVARILIPANKETKILIQPDAGKPREYLITLRPGEKRLIRHRTFM